MKQAFMIILTALIVTAGTSFASAQQIPMIQGDPGGYLGVEIRDITLSEVESLSLPAERGVFILRVSDSEPAQKVGLGEGDVILEFAGFSVFSVRQFQRLVSETPPGRRISLGLIRRGQRLQLEVTVEQRPAGGNFTMSGPGFRIPNLPGLLFEDRSDSDSRPLERSRLGVKAQPLTSQLAENLGVPDRKGLLIMEVSEGSPAERAGLSAGDVIISINGHVIENAQDLSSNLGSADVEMEIIRNRKKQQVTVRLEGASPQEGEKPMRL